MLAHLSPLGWEHVNLTGDYVWGVEQSLSENIDGLRSCCAPRPTPSRRPRSVPDMSAYG